MLEKVMYIDKEDATPLTLLLMRSKLSHYLMYMSIERVVVVSTHWHVQFKTGKLMWT